MFTSHYPSTHVHLDTQGYIDKGYCEQWHINQLTSQAIELRDDVPSCLPSKILEEISKDRELTCLRDANNKAWLCLVHAAPKTFSRDDLKSNTK